MSVSLRFVVDVVIVITLVEFVVLAVWHRRTGRGVNPAGIIRHLLAGLMLMLALRAAISERYVSRFDPATPFCSCTLRPSLLAA